MRLLFVGLPVLLSAGCSDYDLGAIDKDNDGSGVVIGVSPDYIDFGSVGSDVSSVSRTFTITSEGTDDLEVEGLTLVGEDAFSFLIATTDTNFALAPEESAEIEVLFAPTGDDIHYAQVDIASNAANAEAGLVELEGQPSVPNLSITPDPLEFGERFIGCAHQSEATLENTGAETLIIDQLTWTGDDVNMGLITDGLEFPMVLEPGETQLVSFWFNPSDRLTYRGELHAITNEPDGETFHDQYGDGIYAGFYTDPFEMPFDPPADIMFAVDQSCSMNDDASRLATNFSSFITQLNSYSNDWQIMVVNDDDGCTDSGVLLPSTPSYTSIFASYVQAGGGSYTESLLTVGANAIENAAGTGSRSCNTSFLRADAMLHLILVSDEPEQSRGSWSDYVTRIQNAKVAAGGTSGNVRISAIAGDYPSGCGSADAGTGYYESSSATGGTFLSICSDWASPANLATLASTSVSQDTFELTRLPAPTTIEVTHNGTVRSSSEWVYQAADNTVRFLSDIPGEGDTVDISYYGMASCD